MKRFFDDEGDICDGMDLKESTEHLRKALDAFIEAGYMHRDFFQFADMETSLMIYDYELDKALGPVKGEEE